MARTVELPDIQKIVTNLQSSVQQAWRGAGARNVSPIFNVSVPVEGALSRVRFFSIEHTMVGNAGLEFELGPVPSDESWIFHNVGVGVTGGSPDFQLKIITQGAQGSQPLLIAVASMSPSGPGGTDDLLRKTGTTGDESWGRPLKLFPKMLLRLRATSDLVIGDDIRVDVVLEITSPPFESVGQIVGNPVFNEV